MLRKFRIKNNLISVSSKRFFSTNANVSKNFVSSTSSLKHQQQPSSFSEIYDQAEIDIQTPILKAFRKFKQQQQQQEKKKNTCTITSTNNSLLVASAVLASPSTCSCGNICTCAPIFKCTGVNSTLHRQIHHQEEQEEKDDQQQQNQKQKNNNNNTCDVVIKGLLKGCAEQNALGAFAASGNHFEQIRGIVICSLDISANTTKCFPCFACRNYLSKVRGFVSKRRPHQVLKLSCISLSVVDGNENVKNNNRTEKDEKLSAATVISVDCIPGWRTSFREEVVRI
jgi:hypothetical protein